MNILDKIVAHKKQEVEQQKSLYPTALLEQSVYMHSPTVSLAKYIKREDKSGIIAEFKRRSPSKPSINMYAEVEEVTMGYMQAGASALSVLTDNEFFGGSSKDLTVARRFNFCPILRKDFIIDEYQIIEARSIGADSILLIAEILTTDQVASLSTFAHSLDLEVLMELHSEDQLSKVSEHVDLVGVNNRDLTTFTTDINFSKQLADKLPSDVISSAAAIKELTSYGYEGFLIGERFMMDSQPGNACGELIKELNS